MRIESKIENLSNFPIKELIDMKGKQNEAAWRKYFPVYNEWVYEEKR